MNILENLRKGKYLLETELFMPLLIIFVGFSGFGLGFLAGSDAHEGKIQLEYRDFSRDLPANAAATGIGQGIVVGSKNGTKYHYPWCSGAQRMHAENKVWFESIEEAENAGYEPAGNCKGL